MHKQCTGVLYPETMAGVIRIYREEEGKRVYRYQCQSCGKIRESAQKNLKSCNEGS